MAISWAGLASQALRKILKRRDHLKEDVRQAAGRASRRRSRPAPFRRWASGGTVRSPCRAGARQEDRADRGLAFARSIKHKPADGSYPRRRSPRRTPGQGGPPSEDLCGSAAPAACGSSEPLAYRALIALSVAGETGQRFACTCHGRQLLLHASWVLCRVGVRDGDWECGGADPVGGVTRW